MNPTIFITNQKSKPALWFYIFCLLHFLIWIIVPILLYGNPPKDAVEGIAWGNLWLWGYEKHPFLAPWLTALVTDIGGAVGWPIYVLGQLSVFVCFWAIWKLANKIISPWRAFIAVVMLEGINYYGMYAVNFDPNVLMFPFWALTALTFYLALKENQLKWWLLTGIFAGLAMISKYESGVLYFSMLVVLLTTPQGRSAFKNKGLYLAIIIGFLIFLPNLLWLMQHHFNAIIYAANKLGDNTQAHLAKHWQVIYHPLRFGIEQLTRLLPLFLLYIPFYKGARNQLPADILDRRFLLALGLGPLLITLLFSLLTNSELTSSWAGPFFSLTTVLWVAWSQPVITQKRLTWFVILVTVLVVLHVVQEIGVAGHIPVNNKILHLRLSAGGKKTRSASQFFPGKTIAASAMQQWHALYNRPMPYVVGDHDVVINIAAYSSDKPVSYFNANLQDSPWIDENDLRKKGGIFVVAMNDSDSQNRINNIKQRFPALTHISTQSFSYLTSVNTPPLIIWMAVLPPS